MIVKNAHPYTRKDILDSKEKSLKIVLHKSIDHVLPGFPITQCFHMEMKTNTLEVQCWIGVGVEGRGQITNAFSH